MTKNLQYEPAHAHTVFNISLLIWTCVVHIFLFLCIYMGIYSAFFLLNVSYPHHESILWSFHINWHLNCEIQACSSSSPQFIYQNIWKLSLMNIKYFGDGKFICPLFRLGVGWTGRLFNDQNTHKYSKTIHGAAASYRIIFQRMVMKMKPHRSPIKAKKCSQYANTRSPWCVVYVYTLGYMLHTLHTWSTNVSGVAIKQIWKPQ